MGPTVLPDPVISLIQWLASDENESDFWSSGKVPKVTYYPQTKEAAPIYEKATRVVGIKSSGVGAGTGQIVQGRYESMRIDAVASAHNDFEAYLLGKFMHSAILQVRGEIVNYAYDGITFSTKFVNIYQSGGPAPFQDAPGGKAHWRSILYVYSVNFETIGPPQIKASATLQNVIAGAVVEQ